MIVMDEALRKQIDAADSQEVMTVNVDGQPKEVVVYYRRLDDRWSQFYVMSGERLLSSERVPVHPVSDEVIAEAGKLSVQGLVRGGAPDRAASSGET